MSDLGALRVMFSKLDFVDSQGSEYEKIQFSFLLGILSFRPQNFSLLVSYCPPQLFWHLYLPLPHSKQPAAWFFSKTGVSVTEAAGVRNTTTYTVALASQPTAEVTVSLSSGNRAAATVSPASLTFTTTNWSAPQTVTVTGVDDQIGQAGDFRYRSTYISHAARGGGYDTVSGSVRVVVSDDGKHAKFLHRRCASVRRRLR